jgi:hypothetical protein
VVAAINKPPQQTTRLHQHHPRVRYARPRTLGETSRGTTLKIDMSQLSTTSRKGTYCEDIKSSYKMKSSIKKPSIF